MRTRQPDFPGQRRDVTGDVWFAMDQFDRAASAPVETFACRRVRRQERQGAPWGKPLDDGNHQESSSSWVELAQIEVDALAPTLKLVSESALTTVLPAIVARKATTELPLQMRRIVEPVLKRQLVYVYRAQRPLSGILNAFIGVLSAELKRETTAANRPKRAQRC